MHRDRRGVVSRSRSASIGSTIAVDDIASPAPSTIAPCQATPTACASAASAAPVITTCAVPRPNTARRITQSRCGRTSRPIRNSSITTPRLAMRGDRVDVGDQPQAGGADDDAGQQIAEYAAEAGAPCQRHGDGRGGEQDDESGQHARAAVRTNQCPAAGCPAASPLAMTECD